MIHISFRYIVYTLELKFIYMIQHAELMEFDHLYTVYYGNNECVNSKLFGARLQIYLYFKFLNHT